MDARFTPINSGTDVVACCPDWATDDFILWGIYEYLEGGEYAMIGCPHCETVQYVDIPMDAWTIEAERQKRHASEREAVNEVIEAEKLTVNEIIERCPDGYILVGEQHFENVVRFKNLYQDRITELEKKSQSDKAHYARRNAEIAAELARCGSYDHKTKNEVILAVVARLLAKHSPPETSDMDDIPF